MVELLAIRYGRGKFLRKSSHHRIRGRALIALRSFRFNRGAPAVLVEARGMIQAQATAEQQAVAAERTPRIHSPSFPARHIPSLLALAVSAVKPTKMVNLAAIRGSAQSGQYSLRAALAD